MGPKRLHFLTTRWRMEEKRDGGARRKGREKEVDREEVERYRGISGKVKRTTSDPTTLVIVTLSRLYRDIQSTSLFLHEMRNAQNAWRAAIATLFLINSWDLSFYRIPPSSSVRLDNVRRGDKVSHFRWESRHFLSPWYVTIPPKNTQNCAQKLVQFRWSSWVTEEKL